MIPLFPELRPDLEAVFDQAEQGSEHVITRYRRTNANLRTQLVRIIKRAGVNPWSKLFQNLRASRETELAQDSPLHVVCEWIGNSRLMAMEHYLQVTDEDFAKAVQQAHETRRNDLQTDSDAHEKTRILQGSAEQCDYLRRRKVGHAGLEPATSSL